MPESFFNKVAGLKLYQKRDSATSAFLWILRNFLEHLLLQNTSGSCFYRLKIKVMHLHQDLSLEYHGHDHFAPNHHNLILWGSLVCYMSPVMANHLSWYDTVLLPSTGSVKTLLEFLIQHSSHKSNKKVSFDAVNYSSLLVMISNSLVFLCKLFFARKKICNFSSSSLKIECVFFLSNKMI